MMKLERNSEGESVRTAHVSRGAERDIVIVVFDLWKQISLGHTPMGVFE
jgi:hypothetical protein